jgi:hypothetical protein
MVNNHCRYRLLHILQLLELAILMVVETVVLGPTALKLVIEDWLLA